MNEFMMKKANLLLFLLVVVTTKIVKGIHHEVQYVYMKSEDGVMEEIPEDYEDTETMFEETDDDLIDEDDDYIEIVDEEEEEKGDDGCAGGSCPTPDETVLNPLVDDPCGLWMGPSPIKEHETHGFGLGIFTGRSIRKNSVIGGSEVLLPFFDFPGTEAFTLIEYLYYGDLSFELLMQSEENMETFTPGLGTIAACTEKNFNVKPVYKIKRNDYGAHRSRDAGAGSFSYYDRSFVAVRNIVAGEELTVECTDDDFDGGAYFLSRYSSKDSGIVCLDDAVRVAKSTIPKIGKGLYAKRDLKKGEIYFSTPLIPLHRNDLKMDFYEPRKELEQKRLLLNYCYSHPDSDLMFMPMGPMINYINHSPTANTDIQWHTPVIDSELLPERQQHHHQELFDMSAKQASEANGKSLLIDFVASRDIAKGEELFLNYGNEWSESWKLHLKEWKPPSKIDYVSSWEYNKKGESIRTVAEQQTNPYPENIQTACYFGKDWVNPKQDTKGVTHESWNSHQTHACLLPCSILSSVEKKSSMFYTAKLLDTNCTNGNPEIPFHCHLWPGYEYIYSDIPSHAIMFVDAPYSTDEFLRNAFRQPIGVPENLYPQKWLNNKRLRGNHDSPIKQDGDTFKRRNNMSKLDQQTKI